MFGSVALFLYMFVLIDFVIVVCYDDYVDSIAIISNIVNNNFYMEVQNMRTQKNEEVRQLAKECGVKLWEIAEKLGCADATLSRKLRHDLTPADREKVLNIIRELSKENLEGA